MIVFLILFRNDSIDLLLSLAYKHFYLTKIPEEVEKNCL